MLVIDGMLKVIPSSVACDVGTLRVGDESTPAVVQTFGSESGAIQIVFPVDVVDKVIEGLNKAKEESDKESGVKPDLYIPGSAREVEDIAKVHQQVNEGKE